MQNHQRKGNVVITTSIEITIALTLMGALVAWGSSTTDKITANTRDIAGVQANVLDIKENIKAIREEQGQILSAVTRK